MKTIGKKHLFLFLGIITNICINASAYRDKLLESNTQLELEKSKIQNKLNDFLRTRSSYPPISLEEMPRGSNEIKQYLISQQIKKGMDRNSAMQWANPMNVPENNLAMLSDLGMQFRELEHAQKNNLYLITKNPEEEKEEKPPMLPGGREEANIEFSTEQERQKEQLKKDINSYRNTFYYQQGQKETFEKIIGQLESLNKSESGYSGALSKVKNQYNKTVKKNFNRANDDYGRIVRQHHDYKDYVDDYLNSGDISYQRGQKAAFEWILDSFKTNPTRYQKAYDLIKGIQGKTAEEDSSHIDHDNWF